MSNYFDNYCSIARLVIPLFFEVKQEPEEEEEEQNTIKKRPRQLKDDECTDESFTEPPSKKIQRSSSGSEPENSPPNKIKKTKRIKRPLDSSSSESETETESKTTLKKFSFKKEIDIKPDIKEEEVASISTKKPKDLPKEVTDIHSNWLHNSLEFLKPHKIMDINKRRPDHPDYDAKTLHVPDKFLSGLTPAMRQWWELKSHYMDSVLFFKVGKFYELYHMDAVVGVTELNFSYMKVKAF